MLMLSTGDHRPSYLERLIKGKGMFTKEAAYDPGKSYPPISFRYFRTDQVGTRAIPRRLTAFSSKRGHSALLFPVDKLKMSPLGDTGKASSITVGNEQTSDQTVKGDIPIWSLPVNHILE